MQICQINDSWSILSEIDFLINEELLKTCLVNCPDNICGFYSDVISNNNYIPYKSFNKNNIKIPKIVVLKNSFIDTSIDVEDNVLRATEYFPLYHFACPAFECK